MECKCINHGKEEEIKKEGQKGEKMNFIEHNNSQYL